MTTLCMCDLSSQMDAILPRAVPLADAQERRAKMLESVRLQCEELKLLPGETESCLELARVLVRFGKSVGAATEEAKGLARDIAAAKDPTAA